MASKLFRALIIGAPASGKGTISSRITKTYNVEHISSGDRLRLHIKNKTPLGLEAQKYIEQGQLVPDGIMIKFMTEELNKLSGRPWLLDGFPRTVSQAERLWGLQPLDVALNLVVPFEVIIERVKSRWIHMASGRVYNIGFNEPKVMGRDDISGELLEQRLDDQPEHVRKRLEIYEAQTRPVVEFYRKHGILHEFRGSSSDEIWPLVQEHLNSYNALSIRPRKQLEPRIQTSTV